MARSGLVYGGVLLALTAGVAALLAGEFFHGVAYLVPVGGVLALLAVGGLTAAIARADPPATAEEG
ncbi:hypothetical protein [Haloplanus halophilus]|uniref:hypothetical protein n=1 Tax=Haloplanus halophilus TaxID=2949993 RepID=UPI00203AAB6D|nr:hypothetical protein [Haloplanus sp. GDY1]